MQIIISYFKCKDTECNSCWEIFDSIIHKYSTCDCGSLVKKIKLKFVTKKDKSIKCYGRFHCKKCNHRWSSVHTWLNYTQKCYRCSIPKHPYIVDPIGCKGSYYTKKDNSLYNVHKRDQCQKCQEIESGDCRKCYYEEYDYSDYSQYYDSNYERSSNEEMYSDHYYEEYDSYTEERFASDYSDQYELVYTY